MHLLLSLSRISISQMSTFSISFSTRTNPAELNQNNLNIKQFDSDVKQFLTYSSTRSLPLFFRKPALLLFTFFGFLQVKSTLNVLLIVYLYSTIGCVSLRNCMRIFRRYHFRAAHVSSRDCLCPIFFLFFFIIACYGYCWVDLIKLR